MDIGAKGSTHVIQFQPPRPSEVYQGGGGNWFFYQTTFATHVIQFQPLGHLIKVEGGIGCFDQTNFANVETTC